ADSRPAGLQRLGAERATLASHALDAIRAAIVDGRLAAGELYSVAGLAEQFGVSRTPVREALLLLERQGVVRFERNRGVRVLESSAHDLDEVFTLRLLLEVPATHRACALLRDEDLDALDRELAAMGVLAAEGDEGPFMAHDQRFHEVVLLAAGNRRLAAIVGQLRDLVRFRGASTVGRSRDLRAIHAEHVAIRDALRARDADAAASAMRRHLLTTRRLLLAQAGGPAPEPAWPPLEG
ncbi:MAG TPA: GntR family transcriptional regulator, partial [Solirubrobacteraceae bacterium]|nr:GntR family transcriptional regulator [Solirubrobacteraceae bacterium]